MPDSPVNFVGSPRSARGFFVRRVLAVTLPVLAVLTIAWFGWRPLNAWAGEVADRLAPEHRRVNAEPSVVLSGGESGDWSASWRTESGSTPAETPASHAVSVARDDQQQPPPAVQEQPPIAQQTTPAPAASASQPTSSQPATSTQAITPTSVFHYQLTAGDRAYATNASTQLTVLGLMQQLADQGFAFTSKQYDYGVFITGINGVANDPATGRYWTYTVNGQSATVGADQYQLKDGDQVQWSYDRT